MLEIRGHARGGQGMVTAFEILAKIFGTLGGYHVQAFPAFGVERTGAPIQAFLRVSKSEILNRSNIYNPDLIVVFDETLLSQVPVFDGLQKNGAVLINTEQPISELKEKTENIFTIPATKISLEKGLGSKTLPIVNSAMIGAILKLLNADINIGAKIISENVPVKPKENAEAAFIAHESIVGLKKDYTFLTDLLNSETDEKEETEKTEITFGKLPDPNEIPEFPSWSEPMSLNKTGNWRVLTPIYTVKQAPCSANCPAGTDVRGFLRLSNEGKFREAYELILEHNPFPATTGRVCPHFCEQNCNRNELDKALNIGGVERFLGDREGDVNYKAPEISHKEKIAVIGSGPAGLTAALRLRLKGYETTVFEALPQAGGMMRTGIPKFRLPDDALDREIARIEKAGVKIITNKKVTVNELENDFDSVIVAVGSHIGSKMNIPNEELALDGIDFLREFKLNNNPFGISKGDEVAIIGGGNTAIDVSRTALRLGAKPTIYYRRTINEMPAIHLEIEEALAEGVKIEFLTAPVAIDKISDDELELTMIKMELGEPDETGRRKPIPVQGSETKIKANKVIKAIGQKYDSYVFNNSQIKAEQGKTEFESKVPVFCAGDMAWGGTVVEAIGSGNKVAEEVDAFFNNRPYSHEETHEQIVIPADLNFAYYLPTARHDNKIKYEKDFYGNFDEVAEGLTEEEVVAETDRCLHCGECFSCGNCYNYCPDAAVHIDENGRLRIDYDYCKGCGICVQECPCSAIDFKMIEVDYE